MAKFLQETVKESGLKADSVVRSDEFKEFFRKASILIQFSVRIVTDSVTGP